MSDASLPYNGTEGYSSDTGEEEARRQVTEGIASRRQRFLLILAERAGSKGITVSEVRDATLHHGRVSGSLSVLHKAGRLARLKERRNKCHIYVLPEHINGREIQPHGRKKPGPSQAVREAARLVEDRIRRDEDMDALFDLSDIPLDEYTKALWVLVEYAQGRRE